MMPFVNIRNNICHSKQGDNSRQSKTLVAIWQVIKICADKMECQKNLQDGKTVFRSIGIIILGVNQQLEYLGQKLYKKLKTNPLIGEIVCSRHKIQCGGPYQFQGDERDIVLAILLSKKLKGNINVAQWEQAINVSVSRAKERFHLFHQIKSEEIAATCVNDPRRILIEYCQKTSVGSHKLSVPDDSDLLSESFRPEGFALEVLKDLSENGVFVRTCEEFLQKEWKNKLLIVEGERRMVGVVLNGTERQNYELWHAESHKWDTLCRIGWRVVELWHFQYLHDKKSVLEKLFAIFQEENVMRL